MFTLPGTPVIRYGDELGMGDDLDCRSAIARARRCNGRPSRMAASPRATSRHPGDRRRAVRLRARQRRDPAPRSRFDAELDRAHHPHAQGSAGDRLGRFRGLERRAIPRAGDALRLAQQFGLFVHNLL
jgi:hypothetical protein